MDLKDTWKDVGKGLGFAFRDLGKAVIKSAKTGIDEVNNWANPPKEKLPEGETPEIAEITEGETVEATETVETPETAGAVVADSEEKADDDAAPPKTEERKPRFTHDHIDNDD